MTCGVPLKFHMNQAAVQLPLKQDKTRVEQIEALKGVSKGPCKIGTLSKPNYNKSTSRRLESDMEIIYIQ